MMQETKVFEWKFFDSFVRAVLDLGPKGSHPVVVNQNWTVN